MARLDLADGHLERARSSTDAYAVFDSAWKAFNVLYEAEHADRLGNREADLIARAIERLTPVAATLLDSAPIQAFVDLDPIFDEKIWSRSGATDRSKHNVVRKRLRSRKSGEGTLDDLRAIIEALYVVRCNLAHGFKTPDGPRDREVLGGSAPLMLAISVALRATWTS